MVIMTLFRPRVTLEVGIGENFYCPLCQCCSMPHPRALGSYFRVGILKEMLLVMAIGES